MEFRNAKLSELERVQTLFEGFYGENFFAVNKELLLWQHHGSPFRNTENHEELNVWCAFKDEELVGAITYIPHKIWHEGKSYQLIESACSIVLDSARGTYPLLLKSLISKTDFYLTFGATEYLKRLFTGPLKFEYCENIHREVFVLNSKKMIEQLKEVSSLSEEDMNLVNNSEINTHAKKDSPSTQTMSFPKPLQHSYVDKSSESITWRYKKHPFINYEMIEKPESLGVCAYRIEEFEGNSYGRILEFLPCEGMEQELFEEMILHMRDNDILFADFFCGNPHTFNFQEKSIKPKNELIKRIPRLFSPMEVRDRWSLNALLGKNLKRKDELPQISISDLYFTKAEGNQDVFVNKEYFTRGT